jgi:hypothetical protein
MIVWGSGGDVANLGVLETRRCDVCEKDRPFNIILQYRYWGLYWFFNFVTKKNYLLLCDACNRGWEIDDKKLEPHLTKTAIPFMHRYGILVLIGAFFGLFLLISLIGALSAF